MPLITSEIARKFIFFGIVYYLLLGINVSQAQLRFEDTTDAAGGPFHVGETWGAAWGDIDGDIYPDMFSNNHGQLNALYRNNGDGTFTDVVGTADLDRVWVDSPSGDIHGGSWADFDNDGDQDIFSTRSSSNSHVQLMENNGQGMFAQNSGRYRIRPYGGGRMPLLFDYTNDGHLDVAIARNDRAGLEVFRFNPNNNVYVRTTDAVGIAGECLRNNFGFTSDLFNNDKLHYVCMPEGRVAERVFDMSTIPFTDVSNKIDSVGVYTDAVLADFNGDLRQDIFALRGRLRPSGASRISSQRIEAWFAVGGPTNFEKSITFKANGPISVQVYARDVGEPAGLRIGSNGYRPNRLPVTLNPTNSDNSGLVANRNGVFVYAGYNQNTQLWTVMLSSGGGGNSENSYITVSGNGLTEPTVFGMANSDRPSTPGFLLNDGNSLNSSGSRGIGAVQCGGIAAADFDNDMDIDLYLACRTATENIPNRLYLNNGSGQFSRVNGFGGEGLIGAGIASGTGTAEMAVTADYDVDGFMDIFVTNGNRLFPHTEKDGFSAGGPVRFIRNLGNNNRWLQFDLRGVQSNRDGFGAKVFVTAGGKTQVREQNGMYHRWSHDSRRTHFGLASNTQANVRIEWPDGSVDTHNNIASNRLYRATQNGSLIVRSTGNPSGGGSNGATHSLSIEGVTVNEGDAAMVLVTLDSAASSPVTVRYETRDGSALSGEDYSPRSGALTFNTGQITQAINVSTVDDDSEESDESFAIALFDPDGADITQATANVNITDDDTVTNGGPELTIEDITVDESAGNAVVRISLSEPAQSPVEVSYASVSGTATIGEDFIARSGTILFAVGSTVRTRTFSILQDNIAEPDESFTVSLSSTVGATVAKDVATVIIRDDDGGGTPPAPPSGGPELTIEDITVDESAGNAVVRISLSEPAQSPVEVSYASVSGTATIGEDFIARSGTILFAVGSTVRTRTFSILQDNIAEPDESFTVSLSSAVGATVAKDVATIIILDDDGGGTTPAPPSGGPELTIEDITVDESAGNAVVRISLSEPAQSSVEVSYASVSGTATIGEDFIARSGTISFAEGSTVRTRTFSILQDNIAEPDESFTVSLSNAVGATVAKDVATVIIRDIGGITPDDVACGRPNLTGGSQGNIYLWRDCAGNGRWHVDVVAGGPFLQVEGHITTNRTFSNLQSTDFETNDSLTIPSTNRIQYLMRGINGASDGFEFDVPPGSGTCFTLNRPDRQIWVGQGRVPVFSGINIETLVSCN